MGKTLCALGQKLHRLDRQDEKKYMQVKIDLAFQILEAYAALPKEKKKERQNVVCCYASVVLSHIVDLQLAKRIFDFLEKYQYDIFPRAKQMLAMRLPITAGFVKEITE